MLVIVKNWIIVLCISRDLIGLAVLVYEPLHHVREITTIKCLLVALAKLNQLQLAVFLDVFNKTIISLALVGYEVIIANSALLASLAMYLIFNARSRN